MTIRSRFGPLQSLMSRVSIVFIVTSLRANCHHAPVCLQVARAFGHFRCVQSSAVLGDFIAPDHLGA
jgi:hypothetical protein